MAESVERLLSDDQSQDEFGFFEKVVVRYRQVIIGLLFLICILKLIFGYKNHLFYLTSGSYIIYLLIICLIKFPRSLYDSITFRAIRVEINIVFTSILLYFLGGSAPEFYLLFIPWIIAASTFFSRLVSILVTTQIAFLYIGISLITFKTPIENVQLISLITKASVLFLGWWLSQWWWRRRLLSQERKKRIQVLHEFQMEAMNLNIKELLEKAVELAYNQLNSEESALFLQDIQDPDSIVKVAVKAPSPEIEREMYKRNEKYKSGESITGSVFKGQKSIIVPNVEKDPRAKRESVNQYRRIIPSGKILYYIGVPLILDNEVLGVLRVTNRKGVKYSLNKKYFQLSNKGFNEEDRILLEIIAREVAIAIKNAKTKSYLDHLLDNTDEAVIALDQKGIIRKFNKSAERIYGYKAAQAIGMDVRKLYKDEKEARRIMRLLRKAEKEEGVGRISNLESAVKTAEGEIVPIDLSACLLYDETGQWLGSIGLFRDLRTLKALQDRVIQSERMAAMGVIARSVGHELKHDFNSIILYAEALKRLINKNKKASETAHKIINVSEKGTNKLNKMLKAVRPQPPEKKIWDPKELFDDITAELREKSALKGIVFNIQYAVQLPKIEVDSKQIQEVLTNLFSNSLDATEKGGEIKLSLEQKEDKLLIYWENTGESIPEKDIPKIFDPFFTTKKSGAGLGLSLVQMIIINHDGRIWAEPDIQNGAKFCIELPISDS